jgi:DNA invertase Pin-like site-specific DNA recombinase
MTDPTQAEPPTETLGISYIRFSSAAQQGGDSLRRQTEDTEAWCRRNRVRLDPTLTLRDLGVSARHGKHRDDKYALGQFLKLLERGRIPRGSYLIIENLDRLSREDERTALRLWMDILDAGVNIVQLKPETVFRHDKTDMLDVMRAIIELSRAHSESVIKSDRVGKAWAKKKQQARAGAALISRRVPAWLRVEVGKDGSERLVLIPDRAARVRRLFEMCNSGHGLALIIKELSRHKKTALSWDRGRPWTKAYLRKILRGRAVRGDYQPTRLGKPDGEVVRGYYPEVIDEETWLKAQEALTRRRDHRGAVGKRSVSLFSGLLWDATTQSRMLITSQSRGQAGRRHKVRVLAAAAAVEGRAAIVSFPYPIFEAALLTALDEIDPAEVLGQEGDDRAAEAEAVAGEITRAELRLREIEDEMDTGDTAVAELKRSALRVRERLAGLRDQHRQLRQRHANPLGDQWAEAKTLLHAARDQNARLRLRGLLRGLVESVWIVIVPRGTQRIASVQIYFAEDGKGAGGRRDYYIRYKTAGNGRAGGWQVRSWRADRSPLGPDLDFRNRAVAHEYDDAALLSGQTAALMEVDHWTNLPADLLDRTIFGDYPWRPPLA